MKAKDIYAVFRKRYLPVIESLPVQVREKHSRKFRKFRGKRVAEDTYDLEVQVGESKFVRFRIWDLLTTDGNGELVNIVRVWSDWAKSVYALNIEG